MTDQQKINFAVTLSAVMFVIFMINLIIVPRLKTSFVYGNEEYKLAGMMAYKNQDDGKTLYFPLFDKKGVSQ